MPLFRRAARVDEVRRLEERSRTLTRAIRDWLTLVHEMEANGETSGSRYESYLRAYQDACIEEKRVHLQLFNYRRGLVKE
jgi:hypothetical protein